MRDRHACVSSTGEIALVRRRSEAFFRLSPARSDRPEPTVGLKPDIKDDSAMVRLEPNTTSDVTCDTAHAADAARNSRREQPGFTRSPSLRQPSHQALTRIPPRTPGRGPKR